MGRLVHKALLSVADRPSEVVRIDSPRCGRAGRYAHDHLIDRFGADAALPDVLVEVAACERRAERPPNEPMPWLRPKTKLASTAAGRALGNGR